MFFHLETGLRFADMGARTGCELAAGGRISLDGCRHLVKFQPENVMKQKRGPLQRREAFQRKHQRQGNVFLLISFDQGIGKPGANIRFALMPRRFQLIETKPRNGAPQKRLRLANVGTVGLHPADEGLVHDILGVRH